MYINHVDDVQLLAFFLVLFRYVQDQYQLYELMDILNPYLEEQFPMDQLPIQKE